LIIDVSILIVTYNCRDAARACLSSVYQRTHDLAFEIVVVDNASGDGTADMIREEFSAARLLASDQNLGFARGVNLAAKEAAGEYLLLLNPDTMLEERAVQNLLEFAKRHPEYGVYGGRTLKPSGEVDPSSCWGQVSPWSLFCFATILTTARKRSRLFDPESLGRWERDSVREVGMVTGCLLLVPRSLWEELEGFDPRFFMYGEDADFSLRAIKRGFRPVITPDSVIVHEVGTSTKFRPDKMILVLQGKATLIRKHWPSPKRNFGLAMLWLGAGVRALLRSPAWGHAWRARGTWLAGYPSDDALTSVARRSPSSH
jgi:N-acetylglucosaminyl-diphospho-decaprenol L-rhamnosyltransferase